MIGRLYRPQRLRYMRRSANRRWALVRTRAGVTGWMPYRSLCRADDDQALIAAFRAGDDTAFARIHERHHAALERYARKILGRSSEHAEDVVQEAMLRASRALRRDDRHIELRPWLYRLTRNRALDELARVRTDAVDLDDAEGGACCARPSRPSRRRCSSAAAASATCSATWRRCPPSSATRCCAARSTASRTRRWRSSSASRPQATKNLVHRARTNLVKQRDGALERLPTRCARDLLEAHDDGRRASAATYRHLATCARVPRASAAGCATRAAPRRS